MDLAANRPRLPKQALPPGPLFVVVGRVTCHPMWMLGAADLSSGITQGDWLGAGIGLASLGVTAVLAFLVYQLQRRDRTVEIAQQRLQAEADRKREKEEQQEQEEKRRREDREREAVRARGERDRELRSIRRERHREDYMVATQAINLIDEIVDKLKIEVLAPNDSRIEQLKAAASRLNGISGRVEGLHRLGVLAAQAELIARLGQAMPADGQVGKDLNAAVSLNTGAPLNKTIRRMIIITQDQRDERTKILKEVRTCREALAREWGE